MVDRSRNAAADWFQDRIAESPYTQNQFARLIDMTESKLSLAINGLRKFQAIELITLSTLLKLDLAAVVHKAAETAEWQKTHRKA
jgi:hypothetical protein